MRPFMHLAGCLAFAGVAFAAARPQSPTTTPSPTTTFATTTSSPTTTTLAPYVPGPQNCDGQTECLNWLGPYELWCEYINTVGHAGLAFSRLGTSCPPAEPTAA